MRTGRVFEIDQELELKSIKIRLTMLNEKLHISSINDDKTFGDFIEFSNVDTYGMGDTGYAIIQAKNLLATMNFTLSEVRDEA